MKKISKFLCTMFISMVLIINVTVPLTAKATTNIIQPTSWSNPVNDSSGNWTLNDGDILDLSKIPSTADAGGKIIYATGVKNVTVKGVSSKTYTNLSIKISGGAEVTIEDLNITNTLPTSTSSPIVVYDGNANNKLIVSGKNNIQAPDSMAGINISQGNTLIIDTEASGDVINAIGGDYGAGIGGGHNGAGGTITIEGSGNVTATGGDYGAGIGGGDQGAGGTITIEGSGNITAIGGDYGGILGGAGIGGGENGAGGTITIEGSGKVNATGGGNGAGIGGGYQGAGGTITIEGSGNITAIGGANGAGIGGGDNGAGGTITIEGGVNVTATGGSLAAGIGGGENGAGGTITIEGSGNITAIGEANGAGIGGGENGAGGTITIEGSGNITAIGGANGAGIGGGKNGAGGTITIEGSGNITATGGANGAGIGGGDNGAGRYNESGVKITIGGSENVISTGGDYGAGIGGGANGAGTITIEGSGNVTATGGRLAAGIGGGSGGAGGIFNITDNGTGTPNIIAVANNKAITTVSSISLPVIEGKLQRVDSSTSTAIRITGGNPLNTQNLTLPAGYAYFAATVGSAGDYYISAGGKTLIKNAAPYGPFTVTTNELYYFDNLKVGARVSFDLQGGTVASVIKDQYMPTGSKVSKPTIDPTKEMYTFGGWYKEEACINQWNFGTDIVTTDTVLYAKWITPANLANNTVNLSSTVVTAGDTVTITAAGDRQGQSGAVTGDEKYIPTDWSSTETGKSGRFDLSGGSYTASYVTANGGNYIVTANYKKQIWDGTAWVDSNPLVTGSKTANIAVGAVPIIVTPINDLTAVAGDGQVNLKFTAPVGATSVIAQQSINGVNYVTATTSSAITAASTSAVVTGLSNGTTYNFRLVVTGGIHAGISNVTTATPVAVTPPTPEVTAAASEGNITVANNMEGVQDVITVTGLNAGDIVKVYNTSTGGSIIGTGTVTVGQTSAIINVFQLGVNAGNVYVSVTSVGKTESLRTGKAYAAEIRSSSLSISTVTFDKNVSKQTDIDVYVNFNGNTLTGISSDSINNGSMALINGTDYVGNGNVITIKKNYLSNQNVGSFVLTFNFSSGSTQAMTVTIVNTNINDNTTPIIPSDNVRDDKDDKSSVSSNSSTSEVRTVNIFAGIEGSGTPVKVEIKRTTVDGVKLDTIKLETSNIEDAIKKALSGNKKDLIIQIPELKDNPADALEIQLPKASAAKLAENGITLKIDAAKVKMEIPEETLKGLTGDVKISIKEITDQGKIDETKAMVLEIFADINGEVKLLGKPVEIEANYTGKTEITIPLNTENLPKDPVELKKLLDSLAVHVKHSNGEIVTEKGKIVYDEKGNLIGISITVDSFSTFAIVSLSKADMDKLTANNGMISNRAAQNSSDSGNKNSESNLQSSQLPAIKFVGLGHSPLVEGDKEDFIISSGYDGNVQYRIYLNVDGAWQEVTNGYSQAVSGKDTFTITPNYTFTKGQYQGRVYVKKAGAIGSKQEEGIDFDNYYTYNINCVDRDDENRVYTAGNLEITGEENVTGNTTSNVGKSINNSNSTNNTTASNDSFKTLQEVTITGVEEISGIPGPYYYRLHIYDVANDTWTNNIIPYSEKLEWTPSAAGTYVLDIHVITPNSVLWDNVQKNPTLIYGGYEGWKLKTVKINN